MADAAPIIYRLDKLHRDVLVLMAKVDPDTAYRQLMDLMIDSEREKLPRGVELTAKQLDPERVCEKCKIFNMKVKLKREQLF